MLCSSYIDTKQPCLYDFICFETSNFSKLKSFKNHPTAATLREETRIPKYGEPAPPQSWLLD